MYAETDNPTGLAGEPLISLRAAARHPLLLIDGRPRSLNAMHRLCRSGKNGVRLESILSGTARVTSALAVVRFITAINADQEMPRLRICDAVAEADRRAEQMLKAAGF